MSWMKRGILIAGLVALGALGLAWNFKRERNACVVEMNRIGWELATLSHRNRATRLQAEGERSAETGTSGSTAQPNKDGLDAQLDQARAHRARFWAYRKMVYRMQYDAFFRATGLSPAQVEQFLEHKQNMDASMADALIRMRWQGVSVFDPEGRALMAQATNGFQAMQTALLGADGAAQLRQYENAMPVRSYVDNLQGEATLAGAPLSSDQAGALMVLIRRAMQPDANGAGRSLGELDWAAIDAEARTFLSPAQFELYTTTEPPGPMGGGSARFYRRLNTLVQAEAQADSTLIH